MYSASRHCFRSSLFRHTFSICSTRTHYHGRISSDYIVRSTGPDISLPNVSLYDMISKQFCGFGKNACIVNADNGREYSFYEMQENICNFSSNLLKMGFEKGDVLCIVSPNSPEYPAVLLGTLRSGGVVTACNPGGTGEEIASQISGTGAKVVATVPACLPVVRKALSSTGVAAKVIVIGSKPQNISRNLISYQCMLKHPGHIYDAVPTEPDSVAILPFSSGTTGVPKGVMLTNSNIASNILQLIHHELYDPNRNELSRLGLLPFFHMYGMSVVLLSSLYSGTKVVSLPKFDPKTFLGAIEKYKVRMAHVVPPILLFLAKHPLVKCYDLSSLEEIITSAAPIGTEIMKMAVDRTQSKLIRQAYGLTETTLAHMMPRSLGMLHLGSIGQCVKSCRTKVVDIETGDALPPNAKGELWINGPSVMKGYLNNPEATQASITEDGWFKTGDIGYYDDQGLFYITGRLKELIKVKGFQVAPAELEAVLVTHPIIADAAVVGVPDEILGQAPRAFVVRKDINLTEKDVQEFMAQRLIKYKHLAGGVEFIDEIPKSLSGKILRHLLYV